jgi:perosamine synthetase
VARFEAAFAAEVGRAHAIALPSCTSALHLSLLALGVGPGDEVIIPDSTWIASAAPVSYVGATPVFADVDPATWCLTPEAVEAAVTPRTRAVIAVDLYGGMPAMDRLAAVCDRHGLALVEDAAEAIGSSFRGTPAGGFGATSTFSFHGSKTLTTGEGGMVVTDDAGLHERMLFLRDHGRRPGDVSYQDVEVAHKYKMSDLQAALGAAQLERLPELVDGKRRIFGWYAEGLAGLPLTLNAEPDGTLSSYWMTTAVLDPSAPLDGPALGRHLAEADIATRPFFRPLSSLEAYRAHPQAGTAPGERPVADALGRRGLNLPSALCLGEDDVERVCSVVRAALS